MRRQTFADAERHHHVQDLMDAQDARVHDRNSHRDRETVRADREKELASTPERATLPFWCRRCRLDFLAESIREVERDWGDPSSRVGFYRAKCPRGHRCIRLAVDKFYDPYWARSRRACADRGSHAADIVQPHETGFQLLYGRKNKG